MRRTLCLLAIGVCVSYSVTGWAATRHGQAVSPYPASRVSAANPLASQQDVSYYGGLMLSNVQVVVVFWTNSVDPAEALNAPGFYGAITNSAYMDLLAQYSTSGMNGQDGLPGSNQVIGRGSYAGAFAITPSATGILIDDTQIASELVNQLNSGALPQPQLDAGGNSNTLYMIYFPPGYTVTVEGDASCQAFCAYHNTTVYNTTVYHNIPIAYAVIPDFSYPNSACHALCGTDANYVNNFDMACSHELAEAVTDASVGLETARSMGWYDANLIPGLSLQYGEIGDICLLQPDQVGGYMVQKVWSNADGACSASSSLMFTRTLLATSDPIATFRRNVTFSATVLSSGAVNSGAVTFMNGTRVLATVPVNSQGVATFTTNQLTLGLNPITASYSKNGNFGASTTGVLNQYRSPRPH
ncbi:MAG TPA: Ig-like domain-containing protein [Terriglobales bacterium]|nr:Ig-like domain-containing protein [Terriglobales bacterium]